MSAWLQVIYVRQFLDELDNKVIPRDYPDVSSEVADKTIFGSLQFCELFTKLHINPLQGWIVESDREMVLLLGYMHRYAL